jgi:hypothetical protein
MWLTIQRKQVQSFYGKLTLPIEADRLFVLNGSSALNFAFGGVSSLMAYNATDDLSSAVKSLDLKVHINVSTQLLPHRKLSLALCGSQYVSNDLLSFLNQYACARRFAFVLTYAKQRARTICGTRFLLWQHRPSHQDAIEIAQSRRQHEAPRDGSSFHSSSFSEAFRI